MYMVTDKAGREILHGEAKKIPGDSFNKRKLQLDGIEGYQKMRSHDRIFLDNEKNMAIIDSTRR